MHQKHDIWSAGGIIWNLNSADVLGYFKWNSFENMWKAMHAKPYKGSNFVIKANKPVKSTFMGRSIFNRVALKYKEKGLVWIFHRCLNEVNLFFEKRRKKDIEGYRYIGKI